MTYIDIDRPLQLLEWKGNDGKIVVCILHLFLYKFDSNGFQTGARLQGAVELRRLDPRGVWSCVACLQPYLQPYRHFIQNLQSPVLMSVPNF